MWDQRKKQYIIDYQDEEPQDEKGVIMTLVLTYERRKIPLYVVYALDTAIKILQREPSKQHVLQSLP